MKSVEFGTLTISLLAVLISGLAYYGQFIARESDLRLQLISHIPAPDDQEEFTFEGCGMVFLVSNFGNTAAAIFNMALYSGRVTEISTNGFSSAGTHYPSKLTSMPIVVAPMSMQRIDAQFQSCNLLDIAKEISSSSSEIKVFLEIEAIGADSNMVNVSNLILVGNPLSDRSTLFQIRSANSLNLNTTYIDGNLRDFSEITMTVDHGGNEPRYFINRTRSSVPSYEDEAAHSARSME